MKLEKETVARRVKLMEDEGGEDTGPHLWAILAARFDCLKQVLAIRCGATATFAAAGDWSVDSKGDGEDSSGDLLEGVSESDINN